MQSIKLSRGVRDMHEVKLVLRVLLRVVHPSPMIPFLGLC